MRLAPFPRFLALLCLPLLAACSMMGNATPVAADALPNFQAEPVLPALGALATACAQAPRDYAAICADLRAAPPTTERAGHDFIVAHFNARPLGTTLFTGYWEMELPGALNPTGEFRWPVLRPPPDSGRYDRAEIMGGLIDPRQYALVYLRSPADVYFLQLQGTGRIHLIEGGLLRVGIAARNGRRSVPPEKLFEGVTRDMSIPGLRAWAAADPAGAQSRIIRDPSYAFMAARPLREGAGPLGAQGVPLVAGISVATDPAAIPLGAPIWVQTEINAAHEPMTSLLLAQDTGEGLHGMHVDLYFGTGIQAESTGGHEYASGKTWLLVPRRVQ